MTDLEKLKQVFTEIGIGFTESPTQLENHVAPHGGTEIRCTANKNTNVEGYTEFFATFDFDNEGKFIVMSVYE